MFDGELEMALADVRRQDVDAHPPTFGDRGSHLLLVRAERRQDRSHVVDGVVGLEVGRLIRDEPVARRVRLVEPVPLERLEGLEHRVDGVRRHAAFGGLRDEFFLLRSQDRRLLLADRVAQRVRLGSGEATERDRGGHDVLLVDEDPVRLLEIWLQERVEVGHRLLTVLASDVGRDVVHGPRAVERDHGGQVVDRGRLQFPDVAPHPG